MAGHTYQLEPRAEGWRVTTVDDARAPARVFATVDEALLWCARRNPLAIRMPDHDFVPVSRGRDVVAEPDHALYEP